MAVGVGHCQLVKKKVLNTTDIHVPLHVQGQFSKQTPETDVLCLY